MTTVDAVLYAIIAGVVLVGAVSFIMIANKKDD